MPKVIEPSNHFTTGFTKFLKRKYKGKEFSMAEAANAYFQYRYKTTDKWTDPKNITGWVKRREEEGDFFIFTGKKKSKSTNRQSKHYKLS